MFGAALLPFKAKGNAVLLCKFIVPNFFESYLKMAIFRFLNTNSRWEQSWYRG